ASFRHAVEVAVRRLEQRPFRIRSRVEIARERERMQQREGAGRCDLENRTVYGGVETRRSSLRCRAVEIAVARLDQRSDRSPALRVCERVEPSERARGG